MNNGTKFLVLFFTLILLGCADYTNVELANIDYIQIGSNISAPSNYGFPFEMSVKAIMKNGTNENITNHPGLIIESSAIKQLSQNQYQLIEHPISFQDTSYAIKLSLRDESAAITSFDSIRVLYTNGIWIRSSSQNGQSGKQQKKGGATLFSRDGVPGRIGENGENGLYGTNFTAYLWKIEDEVRVRIENDSTGEVWKYKSKNCDTIIIDISGGNGGNASNGGEGGDGKDGKDSKLSGNGGNGGDGGIGGNGGNGGSVLLFIHPESEYLIPKILVINTGGLSGTKGTAGKGGDSGKAIKNQEKGTIGKSGKDGTQGEKGINGPKPVISVINFDFQELD